QAYFEIDDSDDGNAYAWLAVGRFDPPVIALPALDPSQFAQRQQAAAELARTLPLPNLEPQLAILLAKPATELDSSSAIARALVALRPDENLGALAALVGDAGAPKALREKIAQAFVNRSSVASQAALVEAIRTLPRRLQIKLAQALASTQAGAENLLKLVADGQAAASLLLERPVKEKLFTAKPANANQRVEQLTRGLTAPNEQLQRLIETRRRGYSAGQALVTKGEQLFTQHCRVCHQIDGTGVVIGPQLDGIGTRGLERLLEDVLDPNRNVDRA